MKMLKFYDEIKNFEKNYRFLRKKTGKSQKQICEAVHMEQPDLSNIENGKKDITLNVIIALAFAMNMNPVRLFAICMLSPDKIRHIQLNSISISEKERMIQIQVNLKIIHKQLRIQLTLKLKILIIIQ